MTRRSLLLRLHFTHFSSDVYMIPLTNMTTFLPHQNLASLDYSLKPLPQPTTSPLPTPRTPRKPRRPQIRTEPPEPNTHANRH